MFSSDFAANFFRETIHQILSKLSRVLRKIFKKTFWSLFSDTVYVSNLDVAQRPGRSEVR